MIIDQNNLFKILNHLDLDCDYCIVKNKKECIHAECLKNIINFFTSKKLPNKFKIIIPYNDFINSLLKKVIEKFIYNPYNIEFIDVKGYWYFEKINTINDIYQNINVSVSERNNYEEITVNDLITIDKGKIKN